jgi:ATP-binding protein involved in chromosome partitioning
MLPMAHRACPLRRPTTNPRSIQVMASIDLDEVHAALAKVEDPEIHRPITDLGMVKSVDIDGDRVKVAIYLTVSGCPMKDTITQRVTLAVGSVRGVRHVDVELDVMNDEQRKAMKTSLRGGQEEKQIPFAQPGNRTHVYAIASGKGGVGKSSVTTNLGAAMAARGLSVGIVDADIYGHSIPGLLGITASPTVVEGMIMPPVGHGVRAISMLPFKPGGHSQPVAFRGPMLHRALQQFLADVWWGDLDVLLLDLPPGTGDIAISTAQLLPDAQLVVVTTPQSAAADVAVRAGMLAEQTHQSVAGVIENMSGFPCPHCGEPVDIFGVGGGTRVAEELSAGLGTSVPLMGRIPFDMRLREGGDRGEPLVLADPDAPASATLIDIAMRLGNKPRGLVGQSLGLSPAGR